MRTPEEEAGVELRRMMGSIADDADCWWSMGKMRCRKKLANGYVVTVSIVEQRSGEVTPAKCPWCVDGVIVTSGLLCRACRGRPDASRCPENGGPHVPDDTQAAHCDGCGAWLGDGLRALCTKAPPGWSCSRDADHDGPCAARSRSGDAPPRCVHVHTIGQITDRLANVESDVASLQRRERATACGRCNTLGADHPGECSTRNAGKAE